jgi:cytosine/adenosine deaminase-related metal-dependent hydrolase
MVHAGEGVDDSARTELSRLDALGCVGPNTVLVHGVAFASADWNRMLERGASLIWCPSSNLRMFGQTAPVRAFLDASPRAWAYVALGTDSRVSGARDLLDELRAASMAADLSPEELLRMVTAAPARILRLEVAGSIEPGLPADLTIVPALAHEPGAALLRASRRDLRLVVIGGRPVVGAPELSQVFAARRVRTRPVVIDGTERLMSAQLARAVTACPITELGVEVR